MSPLRVESTRGDLVESTHLVSVAVVDAAGTLVASAGDPETVTYWRSAAKPMQALPSVEDGVLERLGLDDRALALACASHSSEPVHRELAAAMLAAAGLAEADLACGPHQPLNASAEPESVPGAAPTPLWNNCSGKHALMLALARHHGWPTAGYQRRGHPVQDRLLASVSRWTGVPADRVALGVDGCTVVCFGLPLVAMARAYARLGTSTEEAPTRVRAAMTTHPGLVAGAGRLCTALMAAGGGAVVAKVGAEGVYCAALPSLGLGLALKVHDGHGRSGAAALLEVLRQLFARRGRAPFSLDALGGFARPPVLDTRGAPVGLLRPTGTLAFA